MPARRKLSGKIAFSRAKTAPPAFQRTTWKGRPPGPVKDAAGAAGNPRFLGVAWGRGGVIAPRVDTARALGVVRAPGWGRGARGEPLTAGKHVEDAWNVERVGQGAPHPHV